MRLGFIEVASGLSDVVLVSGVEKMTDVGGDEATYALGTAADQEYEGYHGLTFPGLYALMARAHMEAYGTTTGTTGDGFGQESSQWFHESQRSVSL